MQNCEYYYNGECRCALDTWDYNEMKDIPELMGRKLTIKFKNCRNNVECMYRKLQAVKNIVEGK